jgi:hypothetical protein
MKRREGLPKGKRKEERKMKKGCGCIEEIPPSLILPFVSDGT